MATSPISNSTLPVAGSTTSTPSSGLDKDAFMKLLVAQLKHQDPTAPTDMNGMTAQMTQFSMLEQMTNLSKSSEATSESVARTQVLAMLGKTVTYLDSSDAVHSGVVEHVDTSKAEFTLTVGGVAGIKPTRITGVQ